MHFEDEEDQNPYDFNMMQLMQQIIMQKDGLAGFGGWGGLAGLPSSNDPQQEQQPEEKNVLSITASAHGSKPYMEDKPLSNLTLISISDLTEFTVHHGCYLKVKFTRPCTRIVAVQGNVQDHEGNAVDISIYNFNTRGKKFQEIFSVGTVIFVKEPFFKIALAGNRNIRVDNPRDIEFQVDPFAAKHKQKELEVKQLWEQEMLREGRDFMASKDYIAAYLTYKSAAGKTTLPQYRTKILLNKAIVSLELNLLEQYREVVDQVLQLDPENLKANYHKVKSLILLEELDKAKKLINKKKDVLQQANTKQLLSLLEIYKNTKLNNINWYDALRTKKIGQYFSQKIEIAKSPFGLGIFAKQKIKPGELLIIEKPLLYVKEQQGSAINAASTQMIRKCEVLLKESKHFRQKFLNLSYSERISMPGMSRQTAQLGQLEIKAIIQTNSFIANSFDDFFSNAQLQKRNNHLVLYQKISMINHACEQNCQRFCLDSTMVIYSTKEINKGEEVFSSYFRSRKLKQRQEKLLSCWNIKCNCKYCEEQAWEQQHGQPKIHIQSQELRRTRLQQRASKTNEYTQLLSEFYDMLAVRLVGIEGRDATSAASMLRRVLKMGDKESVQLILSYQKKK